MFVRVLLSVAVALLVACVVAQDGTHYDNTEIGIDSQWDISGSPYFIEGDVVLVGAELTILPGVEVVFSPDCQIDAKTGILVVSGTPQKPVIFRALKPGNDTSTAAGTVTVDEGGFAFVNFVNLKAIQGVLDSESDNTFTSCTFVNNVNAATNFQDVEFDDCKFVGNDFAITNAVNASLTGTVISGSKVCLQGAGLSATMSVFSNCELAIQSEGTDQPIQLASVTINGAGVALDLHESDGAVIQTSNIYASQMLAQGTFQGSISGNYWGTTDLDAIVAQMQLDIDPDAEKALISPVSPTPFKFNNKKRRV